MFIYYFILHMLISFIILTKNSHLSNCVPILPEFNWLHFFNYSNVSGQITIQQLSCKKCCSSSDQGDFSSNWFRSFSIQFHNIITKNLYHRHNYVPLWRSVTNVMLHIKHLVCYLHRDYLLSQLGPGIHLCNTRIFYSEDCLCFCTSPDAGTLASFFQCLSYWQCCDLP